MTRTGWIALAAAVAILIFQVLVPPAIGLADNGDFAKVIAPFDLYPPVEELRDSAFRYIEPYYAFHADNHADTGFHSSETLLVEAALLLNRVISRPGVFDLRVMGVVHAAVFLLAFALMIPLVSGLQPALRIVLLALAVLMFCDISFAAYYNSFYLDAGAFVFLMLSIVTLLRAVAWGRPLDTCLAVAACVLLLTSKSQHALLALPIAMFLVWKRRALWPRRSLLAGSLAAACVAGAGTWALAVGSPRGYTNPCLFNMIFARLAPTAKDVPAELAALGLDQSYLRYVGMDAFMDRSPMRDRRWVQAFRERTSFVRLGEFYVTHPDRAWDVAKLALTEAALGRPPGIGNYPKAAGHVPYAQSNAFPVWSSVRKTVAGASPWVLPLVFLISVGLIARRFPAAGIALALMELVEFAVSAMTDASEVTRHMFLFNVICDVAVFGAVWAVATRRSGRVRRIDAPAVEPVAVGAVEC